MKLTSPDPGLLIWTILSFAAFIYISYLVIRFLRRNAR